MAAGSKSLAGGKQGAKAKVSAQGIASWPARLSASIEEHKREMRLVTWPSRDQVRSTTVVVIVTVFAFGVYFGVVDYLLAYLQTAVYQYFTR